MSHAAANPLEATATTSAEVDIERILERQVALAQAGQLNQAIDLMPQLNQALTSYTPKANTVQAATAQRIRALRDHLMLAIACEKQAVGDELRKLTESRQVAASYGAADAPAE